MKVLFAVNDEKISESIIKKYQANYKEIISAKNLYYFDAIVKELQMNKSYDRIVISEDLEPYSNKNYDMIDKFLFEKLDNISDEASNKLEGEIPIILICTDRRDRGDQMLVKLFSIGVYSALIGNDRTIENLCNLINTPRNKKEAKIYYRVESEEAGYKVESADNVRETEIQNIINHYKKIGKNDEKYVESFNNIATQYTDAQLKIIAPFLPLGVRAVLEEKCPKYQQLMLGSVKGQIKTKNHITERNIKVKKDSKKIDLINKALEKPKMSDPVIIPTVVDANRVKKVYNKPITETVRPTPIQETKLDNVLSNSNNNYNSSNTTPTVSNNSLDNNYSTSENYNDTDYANVEQPLRRRRGRPSKIANNETEPIPATIESTIQPTIQPTIQEANVNLSATPVKRGRGRPKKETSTTETITSQDNQQDVNLFSLGEDAANDNNIISSTNKFVEDDSSSILPGLSDESNNNESSENIKTHSWGDSNISYNRNENNNINNVSYNRANRLQNNRQDERLPSIESIESFNQDTPRSMNTNTQNASEVRDIRATTYSENSGNLANLLTGDKKLVAFVGTSKNGTSFLVNNLATLLSTKGINTAILDLTKNKNAYYIYTQNDESLRNQAASCIEGLRGGAANGIMVSKNLTVYTTLPNEDGSYDDCENILETLAKNYSLVLLDCDFNTNYNYFSQVQEIYLVQTYDILTIQPLTAFLRELEDRNLINPTKLKVVINKALRVKNLTEKMIIGGISRYNSPDMTYQKELFDINTIMYTTIPFEDQTYVKYLEGLVTCNISLNGYSKGLIDSLSTLGNMVYPLISSKQQFSYGVRNYNDYNRNSSQFNRNIDSTLNKMRNNY